MNSERVMVIMAAGQAVQNRHAKTGLEAAQSNDWQTAHSEMDKAIGATEATTAIIAALSAVMRKNRQNEDH